MSRSSVLTELLVVMGLVVTPVRAAAVTSTTMASALTAFECTAPADLVCVHAARDPSLVLGGKMKRLTAAGKPTGHTLTGDAIFANSSSNDTDGGSSDKATYTVELPSAASYKLWALLFYPGGPPNDANSFFVKVGSGSRRTLGNARDHYRQLHWDAGSGEYDPVTPISLGTLPAGNVTVVIEKREVLAASGSGNSGAVPPQLEILCFTTRTSNAPPTNAEALAALSCAPECGADTDCEDADACTQDTCESGHCSNEPILGCLPCEDDGDCPSPKVCEANACACPAPDLLCIDAAADPSAAFAGAMKRLTEDGVSTAGTLTGDAIFADSNTDSSGGSGDKVTYTVELPASGTWYAWGRLFYPGGPPSEANSFYVKIGSGSRRILGNNKDRYQQWHWDGDGSVGAGEHNPVTPLNLGSLASGNLTVVVEKREVLGKNGPVPPRLEILCFTQSSSLTPPTDAQALEALSPSTCETTTTTTTTTSTTSTTSTSTTTTTTVPPTTTTVPPTTTTTSTTTTTTPPVVCGDYVCAGSEDSCSCPSDCPADPDPDACSSCECGFDGSGGDDGQNSDCWCDELCVRFLDCCDNACATCPCGTTTTTSTSTTSSSTLP